MRPFFEKGLNRHGSSISWATQAECIQPTYVPEVYQRRSLQNKPIVEISLNNAKDSMMTQNSTRSIGFRHREKPAVITIFGAAVVPLPILLEPPMRALSIVAF
jgi:hypothetical protein